jgi:hypothetical protein
MIELGDLLARYDFEAGKARVSRVIARAASDPADLFVLLSHYGSWNAMFGAGVAALAAKIVRSQAFVDPKERVPVIGDRSVLVASYFFDAARDEFDDRATAQRDTHRCLCQAFLKGVFWYFEDRGMDTKAVATRAAEPDWLVSLKERVALGYGGGTPDDAASVFRAMGYHLGSELLADAEFSVIDESLKESVPALVTHLEKRQIEIAGEKHNAYLWVRAHSGHGGGAEADHFDWAMRGVNTALCYLDPALHASVREALLAGFDGFARDHDEFFNRSSGAQ